MNDLSLQNSHIFSLLVKLSPSMTTCSLQRKWNNVRCPWNTTSLWYDHYRQHADAFTHLHTFRSWCFQYWRLMSCGSVTEMKERWAAGEQWKQQLTAVSLRECVFGAWIMLTSEWKTELLMSFCAAKLNLKIPSEPHLSINWAQKGPRGGNSK